MTYQDLTNAHIRLSILRGLSLEEHGYTLNESILHDIVRRYGLKCSRDCIRTQLAWLREQGLVTLEQVSDSCIIATLTGRGLDVANGEATVPGVKRPSPGDRNG
ncbi:hypothetical protein EG829_00505 [bacterium]|nr:hypothetical protein [bacterium]